MKKNTAVKEIILPLFWLYFLFAFSSNQSIETRNKMGNKNSPEKINVSKKSTIVNEPFLTYLVK